MCVCVHCALTVPCNSQRLKMLASNVMFILPWNFSGIVLWMCMLHIFVLFLENGNENGRASSNKSCILTMFDLIKKIKQQQLLLFVNIAHTMGCYWPIKHSNAAMPGFGFFYSGYQILSIDAIVYTNMQSSIFLSYWRKAVKSQNHSIWFNLIFEQFVEKNALY